jgi:hypothetical protein
MMTLETLCVRGDVDMSLWTGLDGRAVHAEIVPERTTGYEREGSEKDENTD